MVAVVPELGAGGWVTDPLKTLDLVIAHAFETDYSQSTIYVDQVVSVAYILQQYQHNPTTLMEQIQTALQRLLNRYFDASTVTTSYVDSTTENRYSLHLNVMVKRDGLSYSLTHLYNIVNGRFIRVLEEINR